MFFKKRPLAYKYFVSYYVESDQGNKYVERTDVHLSEKINSIQDIYEIEEWLLYSCPWFRHVRIINYRLMAKSKDFMVDIDRSRRLKLKRKTDYSKIKG